MGAVDVVVPDARRTANAIIINRTLPQPASIYPKLESILSIR